MSSQHNPRAVLRNTSWNVLGYALPAAVALFAVPILLNTLGAERFGILTLVWVVFGYFGLFDFGLGRATTRYLAAAFDEGRARDAQVIFWKSFTLNLFLGIAGGAFLAMIARGLVNNVLNVRAELRPETTAALIIMALALPSITLMSSFRGTLEARHQFRLANWAQIPVSIMTYGAPLLVVPYSHSLPSVVAAIVLTRIVGAALLFVLSVRQLPAQARGPVWGHGWTWELLRYGGWLSVTNVIGPLMVSADRFVIGSLSSMTAVAYYTAPFEAVSRITILGQALGRTVLPIYSTHRGSAARAGLYVGSLARLGLVLAAIASFLICFAGELLNLWLGPTFADRSTVVLQILGIGFAANGLAAVPAAIIHGLGRPDLTAKFHLTELPFYGLLLYLLIDGFGITGAACAWAVRAVADTGLHVAYAMAMLGIPGATFARHLWPTLLATIWLLMTSSLISTFDVSLVARVGLWAITASAGLLFAQRLLPQTGRSA